jgi:isochorismate pyruvate lyase
VRRVRERTAAEGGQPDMMEAVYRHLMEECIAYEHREFARLREGGAQDGA